MFDLTEQVSNGLGCAASAASLDQRPLWPHFLASERRLQLRPSPPASMRGLWGRHCSAGCSDCTPSHSSVQYCTVQYRKAAHNNAVPRCLLQYSTIQYVRFSAVPSALPVPYSTVLYCIVPYSTLQYSTVLTVTSDLMVIVWSLQDSTCKQTQPIDLHSAWQPAWQRPRSTQLCTAAQRLQDSTCDYCSPFNSQCKKTRVSHCLSVRRCAYILSSTVQYLTFCEPHRRVQDTAAHNTVHSTVEYCTVQYSVVLEPRG